MTSNRGEGRVPLRAGADPQLEQQYYQRKHSHPQPGELCSSRSLYFSYSPSTCLTVLVWPRPSEGADEDLYRTPSQESPSSLSNGLNQEAAALSMAEIASCSYEAR